jgi:hypothetical protein
MKSASTDKKVLHKLQQIQAEFGKGRLAAADQRGGTPAAVNLPRYAAEAEILARAIEGDLHAIIRVLQYLNSSHPDLRLIIQETIHDSRDPRLWRILLSCLATGAWVDYQRFTSDYVFDQRSILLHEKNGDTLLQSIAEAYAIDESEEEKTIKQMVLSGAMKVRYAPLRRIRHASAWIFGLRGDVRVIPILAEMIDELDQPNDTTWPLRAVEALAVINDESCGTVLIKALAKDRGELHQHARRALSDMGHLAVPAWIAALRHEDSHVRWHAARALGQLGDLRGVDRLAEGLYDENHAVRWATASVLANLDAAAIPAVLRVLTLHVLEEPYRQAVYHALHAMPARQTQEYLNPILEALRGPSAGLEAPVVAQRLLSEWNPGKT